MLPVSFRPETKFISRSKLLDDDTCPISLKTLKELAAENDLVATPCCNKKFSKLALEEWLLDHTTCPLCRHNITNTRLIPIFVLTNVVAAEVLTPHTPPAPTPVVLPIPKVPGAHDKAKPVKIHKISKKESHKEEKKLLKLEKELKERAKAHDEKHKHHHHHHHHG